MIQQAVNKDLVKERFSAGLETYSKEAVVQQAMASELATLIKSHATAGSLKIFEAGCGSGFLTRELLDSLDINSYIANDLVEACEKNIKKLAEKHKSANLSFLTGDIENLDFGNNYDLITGNAIFQWLAHPAKFWQQTASRLNSNGLLAVTLFGEDNFKEINALTGVSLKYQTVEQLKELFSPYYNIVDIYSKHITLKFHTGREVLRHIRHTGTSGIKREHWNKQKLLDFEAAYLAKFGDENGLIPLTYQPIFIIAKVKNLHE